MARDRSPRTERRHGPGCARRWRDDAVKEVIPVGAMSTVLQEIERVVATMDEAEVDAFAGAVLALPRVFVTGEGRSGLMARTFAMRLAHLGLAVAVVGETTTPPIRRGDGLVAVSGSGTTAVTRLIAEQASEAGASVLAVTTDPDSPLARLASRTPEVPAATKWRRDGEPATEQPLGSLFDQCAHVALDAVCLVIARRRGLDNERAREQHANVE